MLADLHAAPEQYGDVEPVAAGQFGVGIHIDLPKRRQGQFALQQLVLLLELLAQPAAGPGEQQQVRVTQAAWPRLWPWR